MGQGNAYAAISIPHQHNKPYHLRATACKGLVALPLINPHLVLIFKPYLDFFQPKR
jgi:hypothetical protein